MMMNVFYILSNFYKFDIDIKKNPTISDWAKNIINKVKVIE